MLATATIVSLGLAGCGGSGFDSEGTVRSLVGDELTRQGYGASTLADVSCVDETARRFQCIVTLADGGVEQKVAGTLVCDSSGDCLWRGQNAGG